MQVAEDIGVQGGACGPPSMALATALDSIKQKQSLARANSERCSLPPGKPSSRRQLVATVREGEEGLGSVRVAEIHREKGNFVTVGQCPFLRWGR